MLLALLVMSAVVGVGCGGSGDGSGDGASASSEPVNVLAVLDMTGATKYLGTADKAGLDAAVTYLNGHGGIDGHKVQLEVISGNGDPTTAATVLIKYLSSHPKPTFLLAGSFSSITAALQPIATRNDIVSAGYGNVNHACRQNAAEKCGPFFVTNVGPDVLNDKAVEYFTSEGYDTVGVIQDQRETSVTESKGLQQVLPGAGIRAEYVTTPAKSINYTPQMNKLKAAGVDVVWAEQIGPAVGYVLDARQKLDWNVPIVFDISGASSDITNLAPKSQWSDHASMEIYSDTNPEATNYPGRDLMLSSNPDAKQKGGFGGQPLNVAAPAWDALLQLDAAISATHSLDATVIQKWLEQNEVPLPKTRALVTTHKYTADDHENQGWTTKDLSIVPVRPVGDDGILVARGGG